MGSRIWEDECLPRSRSAVMMRKRRLRFAPADATMKNRKSTARTMAREGATRVNWPSVRLGVTLIIVSWLVMVGAVIDMAIGAVVSGAMIASAASGRSGARSTFMAGAIALLAIVVLYLAFWPQWYSGF